MTGAVAARTSRFARMGCFLGALWLFIPISALAQDPPAEAKPDSPGLLSFDHLDAYLEFVGEFDYRKVETQGRSRRDPDRRQTNRQWSFQERIGLELGGYILDPQFLTFGGELSFALTQDRFKEYGDFFHGTDRDNGYLVTFDLRANFFPGQRHSGTVYGLRREDRINRRFQPTLNQQRTGFGTHWLIHDDKIPMELSYDYLETDRTGNSDPADDEHYTQSAFRYGADWLMTADHTLKLSYEHADTKQEYQGLRNAFETTRDLLILDQELRFGAQRQHTYRTRVRWQEESGDFARDLFEIGPQLTLKHSDALQSRYTVQFNRERYEGLDVETNRADVQLIHQLYTNLTTTLDIFGLYENIEDDIETSQYGASVDWQYNRKNPLGHFFANLALAYDTEEVRGDNGRRIILDEAHAFRDPLSVWLRNRNVVPGTVVVTDTSNRRVFRAGVDYILFLQENVTRISRIRTGQIADRDTILVDYQVFTPARGQLDTIRTDFSIEQRFTNGLSPYYRLAYRNQEDDVSTGFLRRADRTNHHRLGVTYQKDRYNVGAEYEIFDDTIDPYDAYHLDGLLHVLRRNDHTLDASARFSRLFFEGGVDRRNVDLLDVDLDHRWRLTDALSTVGRVGYRWEDDSVAGITNAWDFTAGLEYVVGDLSGELTIEYDRLDLPESTEDDFGVYLRVRREVSHAFASR